ncbi:hypothetical protein K438DRAFT_1761108 [Mycena galopus ATCC 62051]|nr:hypothetical protein K438DRAFT_1761108 [Mycena galopus ATCC 62051]
MAHVTTLVQYKLFEAENASENKLFEVKFQFFSGQGLAGASRGLIRIRTGGHPAPDGTLRITKSVEESPKRSGPSRQSLRKFAEIRLDTDRITYHVYVRRLGMHPGWLPRTRSTEGAELD